MASCAIAIECNAAEILADLDMLKRAASASVEVRNRLAQLGELRADELCVDRDDSLALGTRTARVRFQLPQRFRELVTAVARDGYIRICE